MRPLFPSILGLLFCFLAANLFAQAQTPKVFDVYEDLEKHVLNDASNSVIVVNFWATYCGPCVKELPYFDSLQNNYRNRNVKVVLVSLDFRNHIKERVEPFLAKHHLSPELLLLADMDADNWIPKVSAGWDGGLPFTLILKKGEKTAHPEEFKNYKELSDLVTPMLDPEASFIAKHRK